MDKAPPRGGTFGGHGMYRRRAFMRQNSVIMSLSCGRVCSDGARHRLPGMCRSCCRGFRRGRFAPASRWRRRFNCSSLAAALPWASWLPESGLSSSTNRFSQLVAAGVPRSRRWPGWGTTMTWARRRQHTTTRRRRHAPRLRSPHPHRTPAHRPPPRSPRHRTATTTDRPRPPSSRACPGQHSARVSDIPNHI